MATPTVTEPRTLTDILSDEEAPERYADWPPELRELVDRIVELNADDLKALAGLIQQLRALQDTTWGVSLDGWPKDFVARAVSVRTAYAFGDWPPAESRS